MIYRKLLASLLPLCLLLCVYNPALARDPQSDTYPSGCYDGAVDENGCSWDYKSKTVELPLKSDTTVICHWLVKYYIRTCPIDLNANPVEYETQIVLNQVGVDLIGWATEECKEKAFGDYLYSFSRKLDENGNEVVWHDDSDTDELFRDLYRQVTLYEFKNTYDNTDSLDQPDLQCGNGGKVNYSAYDGSCQAYCVRWDKRPGYDYYDSLGRLNGHRLPIGIKVSPKFVDDVPVVDYYDSNDVNVGRDTIPDDWVDDVMDLGLGAWTKPYTWNLPKSMFEKIARPCNPSCCVIKREICWDPSLSGGAGGMVVTETFEQGEITDCDETNFPASICDDYWDVLFDLETPPNAVETRDKYVLRSGECTSSCDPLDY